MEQERNSNIIERWAETIRNKFKSISFDADYSTQAVFFFFSTFFFAAYGSYVDFEVMRTMNLNHGDSQLWAIADALLTAAFIQVLIVVPAIPFFKKIVALVFSETRPKVKGFEVVMLLILGSLFTAGFAWTISLSLKTKHVADYSGNINKSNIYNSYDDKVARLDTVFNKKKVALLTQQKDEIETIKSTYATLASNKKSGVGAKVSAIKAKIGTLEADKVEDADGFMVVRWQNRSKIQRLKLDLEDAKAEAKTLSADTHVDKGDKLITMQERHEKELSKLENDFTNDKAELKVIRTDKAGFAASTALDKGSDLQYKNVACNAVNVFSLIFLIIYAFGAGGSTNGGNSRAPTPPPGKRQNPKATGRATGVTQKATETKKATEKSDRIHNAPNTTEANEKKNNTETEEANTGFPERYIL